MQRVNSDHSKRVSGGTIAAGNTSEVAGDHDGRCKDWGLQKKDNDDRGEEAARRKIDLGA
jgi:hypothetical protein